MNRTVFYKDGTIMTVEHGDNYLKRLIKMNERYNGYVPYRFTPYTREEIERFWEGRK